MEANNKGRKKSFKKTFECTGVIFIVNIGKIPDHVYDNISTKIKKARLSFLSTRILYDITVSSKKIRNQMC